MTIFYHPRFQKSFRILPANVQQKTEKKVSIFRKNQHNPLLKTHKLHGKLKDLWSFSIDAKYRVVFEFDNLDVIFLDVGDHDLYK